MKHVISIVIVVLIFTSVKGQKKWQYISATNPNIEYMGRVELKKDQARFNWPGVAVFVNFTGKKLGIKIKGGESNYFNVWVDDRSEEVFCAPNDTIWQYPGKLGRGLHYLRLVKRTEGNMGMANFYGVYIGKKEKIFPSKASSSRRILFIGNSITCGYGTEGKNKEESFKPSTENCEKSYATIIARAFDAQYQLISHSGLGMVRNYGDKQKISVEIKPMPARLEYFFDGDSIKKYDLKRYIPDAVVINLGTNDFSTEPLPDEADFIEAGEKLIFRILDNFPGVKIFCITGPMINEPCFSYTKKIVEAVRQKKSTNSVVFIGVPCDLLNANSDLGADWHPSYKGQAKSANMIIPVMSNVLGWDYSLSEIIPLVK